MTLQTRVDSGAIENGCKTTGNLFLFLFFVVVFFFKKKSKLQTEWLGMVHEITSHPYYSFISLDDLELARCTLLNRERDSMSLTNPQTTRRKSWSIASTWCERGAKKHGAKMPTINMSLIVIFIGRTWDHGHTYDTWCMMNKETSSAPSERQLQRADFRIYWYLCRSWLHIEVEVGSTRSKELQDRQ